MKWNKLGSYLVTICLLSLAAATPDAHAISVTKDTKKQSFTLAPKSKNPSFINLSKLNDAAPPGPKRLKAKVKPKGSPAAVFNFGSPIPDTSSNSGHTVSVEMVSLSLVTSNLVSLDPLLGKGSGERGNIILSLLAPAPALKFKAPAKLDPNSAKKKQRGEKGEGKLDLKFSKQFKVSGKKKDGSKLKKADGSILSKKLATKDFKASGVGFAFASPITITDPSFCLENGTIASICLAPMINPVPLPGTLALMAPALGILLAGHIVRRRRQKGGGPSLA